VKFNQYDGSFSFRNEFTGIINIKGEGFFKVWTEKALNRAGYSVSGENSTMTIRITDEPGCIRWILEDNHSQYEFSSLYDLVGWLYMLQK
jgi:hypothetical protein